MSAITETYTFSGAGEDFGPKKGNGIITLHTFEPSDPLKTTMRDARAGAIWQDRHDVLGAYNRIIAVDGVLGCVPDDRISGGMAAGAPEYRPLAWLFERLPANKVWDGNAYSQQLCAMGRRAYFDLNGWPAGIIDGYARSIIDEEERTGLTLDAGLVLTNHSDFQPGNRSDAGPIATQLVLQRYAELKQGDALIMSTWIAQTEDWDPVPGAPFEVGGQPKAFGDAAGVAGVVITTYLNEVISGNPGSMERRLVANFPDPVLGPDVLVIPRRSLARPRNKRAGVALVAGGFTQAQVNAAVLAAVAPLDERLSEIKRKTALFSADVQDD